ncbi:hypothetical protein HZS_3670 [Henneguya salminicola]|nr:hypothetical protein HZS_3670 [Henneguya salminicola]
MLSRKKAEKYDAAYYRCSMYKSVCKASLLKHGVTVTEKRVHTCRGKIVSVTIPNEEMSPDDYINSSMTEKSSQLSLSSSQIFQWLILFLKERFVNVPYTIPSKGMIYSTIRNNRVLIGMNPIMACKT